MNTLPTVEERMWAVLSHLSALAFGMGILLPVIGWSEQRRKSKYATFQCLQALGYQSLGYTVWLLAYLIIFLAIILLLVFRSSQAAAHEQAVNQLPNLPPAWIYGVLFGSFALYFLPPVVAAIACGLGRDFRYPILGRRLANYIGYGSSHESDWLIEEHEDRWVVAMGHFSVIVALWGLLAPLSAWIVQGTRSSFVKFQSVQTTIYQALVNLFTLGTGFAYFSGLIVLLGLTGLESNLEQDSNVPLVGLGLFGIAMLCASLVILVIPFFHILGQWAGYRVLKGDDYHYPVVGKWTKRWLANRTSLEAERSQTLKGESP